jgi:uncharacterized protein YdbL (DUF1318 family)
MKRVLLLISTLLLIGWLPHASALTLSEARSAGLVAELPSGYLKACRETAAVSQLVAEINAKRRAVYQKIANQNGVDESLVAEKSAKKIQLKLDSTSGCR